MLLVCLFKKRRDQNDGPNGNLRTYVIHTTTFNKFLFQLTHFDADALCVLCVEQFFYVHSGGFVVSCVFIIRFFLLWNLKMSFYSLSLSWVNNKNNKITSTKWHIQTYYSMQRLFYHCVCVVWLCGFIFVCLLWFSSA